ncbi:MAG: bifunctional riboflavin kinase/FAD synthetase [Candidatus Protistobacter heckmanni]|nr:bifunctional riboflavin kinase/FAD synthetase [Candidatus Protistobacter heckmanni]
MNVFHGLPPADQRQPCALTIGNFDGVHRGHQAMLEKLRNTAAALSLPTCVMTFEPHPREFFAPAQAPARIYGLRDKLAALRECGVDTVVVARFNARFAVQKPEEFIDDVLVRGLYARHVLVGDDFRFGARRAGDFASLREAGWANGFTVEAMDTVNQDGQRVSSTLVREALAAGDLARAAVLLSRPYTISGHVVHGAKLGRELGFPTLNMRVADRLHHRKPALAGSFAVRVHGLSGEPLPGVASLGLRPTVDDSGRWLLETHLFDYAGDVYGRTASVEFMHKLRDEARFEGMDALREAIAEDSRQARAWLGLAEPARAR